MIATDEFVHILILFVLNITAITVNAILVAAIRTRTPSSLHAYSALLLANAIVDIAAAAVSLTVAARFINVDDGIMVLLFGGPCTVLGARFCHAMKASHGALVSQSTILVLISFCYRIWMLGPGVLASSRISSSEMRTRLWKISFISSAPCWILLIATYNSGSSIVVSVDALLPGHEYVAINLRADARTTAICSIFLFNCYFAAIVAARRRLLRHIRALNSATDRARNQMICNSLTAQSFLPLSTLVGTSFFLIDLFGFYRSPYLQRSAHIMTSVLSLASPLITLFFLPPYRKWMNCIVSNQAASF